jgi:hypothetical protein
MREHRFASVTVEMTIGDIAALGRCDDRATRCRPGLPPPGQRRAPDGGPRLFVEWARQDLNLRPFDYESSALTN